MFIYLCLSIYLSTCLFIYIAHTAMITIAQAVSILKGQCVLQVATKVVRGRKRKTNNSADGADGDVPMHKGMQCSVDQAAHTTNECNDKPARHPKKKTRRVGKPQVSCYIFCVTGRPCYTICESCIKCSCVHTSCMPQLPALAQWAVVLQ